MRLQFAEGAAQLLLNPVHIVEERSAVNLQFAAAQAPIRAQQEVIFENAVFVFAQRAAGNQNKIGHELFILHAPHRFPLPARVRLQ